MLPMRESLVHPFPPVCGGDAKTLILGTFPSVRSRAEGFYYAHPQNRFWRVIAGVYGEETPTGTPEKRALLSRHGLALWDVLESCEIEASSDASITCDAPNDVAGFMRAHGIEHVLANGKKAYALYMKHIYAKNGFMIIPLPSTSPANAAVSLNELISIWGEALKSGGE